MTLSPPAALLGAQAPRLHSAPVGAEDSGQDAIEFASQAGLWLDPWQQLVLRQALRERAGKWSAFEVGLVVPRQNGKGSILEALELFLLFLPDPDGPPPLILHSAHEFKTSAEHFRRMRDLIEGTPHLASKVRIIRTAAGSESIELHSGARLRFVTRTGGSGRGFSADTIVIDEAYNLTPEAMAAVLPTMSARPNPQVWYTSSAGMLASEQLRRLRERGVAGSARLAYFEWSAPDDSGLDDRLAWAQANPALGIRISPDFVEAEREAMPEEQFARERLGIWPSPADSAAALDLDAWGQVGRDVERGSNVVFGVDVDEDRMASVCVAWKTPAGVHGEVVSEPVPAHALPARCAELVGKWGGRVAAPSWLVEDLQREGVPVIEVKASAWPLACASVVDALAAGSLSHGNHALLSDAAKVVRWATTSSSGSRAFRLKDSPGAGPFFAFTRAVHTAATLPSVYEEREPVWL